MAASAKVGCDVSEGGALFPMASVEGKVFVRENGATMADALRDCIEMAKTDKLALAYFVFVGAVGLGIVVAIHQVLVGKLVRKFSNASSNAASNV